MAGREWSDVWKSAATLKRVRRDDAVAIASDCSLFRVTANFQRHLGEAESDSGMISRRRFLAHAAAVASTSSLCGWNITAAEARDVSPSGSSKHELIRDPHFRAGFNLVEPTPGRRVIYGRLAGRSSTTETEPVWDLDQWSSRFPLEAASLETPRPGVRRWKNDGKVVTRGEAGTDEADLTLRVNAISEYRGRARKSGEPWVHLLVEQSFLQTPSLADLASARLQIEARLRASEPRRTADYDPGLHAAQFQMFLMVQNRNHASRGYGRLLWFGIPLFDDRARFPKAHQAQDTGGTSMFIFTPAGDTYAKRSAHDREWIRIDYDLQPLLREAVSTAWRRGFLTESHDWSDYRLTGMNLGWEVPGLFDVEMQVRGLSLAVQTTERI